MTTPEAFEKHLLDALHSASRDYDQAVLAVSGGTLALSATFAKDFASDDWTRWLLLAAWGSLVLAILAVVISFQTSQSVMRSYLERAVLSPRAAKATDALNKASGGFLVFGLVLLSLYAFLNL